MKKEVKKKKELTCHIGSFAGKHKQDPVMGDAASNMQCSFRPATLNGSFHIKLLILIVMPLHNYFYFIVLNLLLLSDGFFNKMLA